MTIPILSGEALSSLSTQEALEQLQSRKEGLNPAEVGARLKEFGPNALAEKKVSPLKAALRFFWGPIPWMIEIAAVLSLLAKDFNDFAIILFLLLMNAAIGFFEERKAGNALAALKAGLALTARAKRGGSYGEVKAAELVPGDIIRIRLGDVVPADCKLIEGDYLTVDQAALTGESLPVNKGCGQELYSGSIVKQGEMEALVSATGEHSFFGRTAKLVEDAGASSHFQQAVMRVGDFLIVLSLILCALLSVVVLHRDFALSHGLDMERILNLAKFILILTIASIPVAMPAVLSVTMALGALVLSKNKAIVSRLQAIEEMAGVDVLCSDKTGTLTQNKLTLDAPVLFGAKSSEECVLAAALASSADSQDSIDDAIIAGLEDKRPLDDYERLKFVPFDPVRKRIETTVRKDGQLMRFSKGAPQVILDLCAEAGATAEAAQKSVADFARRGYRTLGVAKSPDDGESWQFLGIIPMFDPPRVDSKSTIAQAKEHGLAVKMVTGDDTAIASEISGQLGLGTHIQAASDIFGDHDPSHLPDTVGERIERADGFARVFPEHKYGIVKALQDRGHIVAMTGDGVNDAPALKQADAGVAVSGATDAARAAAALVLVAPGLSVIIKAIQVARQIFERMMSYTIYRIAMTMDVMFFVVLAMIAYPTVPGVAGSFMPLTPIMIILLALLDDIPIMTIAYDNAPTSPKPVRWDMRRVLSVSTVLGLLSVVQTFGLLAYAMNSIGQSVWGVTLDAAHIQTMMFLQLVVGGHLMLFVTRTKGGFWDRPWPALPLVAALLGTQLLAALLCGLGSDFLGIPALPWTLVGLVWAYNLVWMLIQDVGKRITYGFAKQHHRWAQRLSKRAAG